MNTTPARDYTTILEKRFAARSQTANPIKVRQEKLGEPCDRRSDPALHITLEPTGTG